MSENTNVWEVFIQSKNGLAHKHVGNVHASDKEMHYKMREIYIQEEMKVVVFGWLNQNILFPLNQKMEKLF